jgi:Domain of unknown function (DUF4260)
MAARAATPAVTGKPLAQLKLEGAALLVAATLLYWHTGMTWWLYFLLFLAPDLSFAGYLGGPRMGALVYNAIHSIVGPMALAITGILTRAPLETASALIWFAHIGFDHMLGYGLKYDRGFTYTHLGRIGDEDED